MERSHNIHLLNLFRFAFAHAFFYGLCNRLHRFWHLFPLIPAETPFRRSPDCICPHSFSILQRLVKPHPDSSVLLHGLCSCFCLLCHFLINTGILSSVTGTQIHCPPEYSFSVSALPECAISPAGKPCALFCTGFQNRSN